MSANLENDTNNFQGRNLIEKFVKKLKNKISKDPEEIFLSEDDLKFSRG